MRLASVVIDVFLLFLKSIKGCRFSVNDREAATYVQGYGLKVVAPFSYYYGFELPITKSMRSGDHFIFE
jgi:hypothetical protein